MIPVETGVAWPLSISITFAILIFGTAWAVQRRPGRAFHSSSWLAILGLYWAVIVVGVSDPPSGNTTVAILGWALGAGGCSLVAIGLIARARKATWPRSVTFSIGVLCIVAAVVVLVAHAYVIAAVAGAFGAWLALRQMKREHDALKALAEQLADATEWRQASDDPEVGDPASTMGLWNGARVWLDSTMSGVRVRSASSRWPSGLLILPERSAARGTGDDVFDRLFSVQGEEPDRRSALTAAIRSQLTALGKIAKCTLRNQTIEVVAANPDRAKLAVDRCVELIAGLPETSGDQMRRVFDATRAETHARVRADGYRWLIAQSWRPAEVYEAAAADADAAIAAWGREHLPYSAGAFR